MKLRIPPSLALLFLAGTVAASAQTVTPVPAPTIITTAPYTISKPGYYQLGADLTFTATSATGNIITINSGNVTLDFAGHYISGPNTSNGLYGVYVNEKGNITVKNGSVVYCSNGIYFGGNGDTSSLNINQRIDNMLISYCSYNGIWFNAARNSEITNCRVSFIGSTQASSIGIYSYNSTGMSLLNNVVTSVTNTAGGGAFGIQCANSDSTTVYIVGNRISSCSVGISGGKCQNNLTGDCATPYRNTTDAGGND